MSGHCYHARLRACKMTEIHAERSATTQLTVSCCFLHILMKMLDGSNTQIDLELR